MEFSREEIMAEAERYGASPMLQTKFKRMILDRFPSVAEFLHCNETEVRRRTPFVGEKMEALMAHLRQVFCDRAIAEKNRVEEDERIVAYKKQLAEEKAREVEEMNARFSLADLQGIVSMMQLMNLNVVDLRLINQFMNAIKAKEAGKKGNEDEK